MKAFLFLLLTVLLVSCAGNGVVPSDIIPTEKMGTIIWQLMQSDEFVNGLLVKDSTKKSSTERMKIYQRVFDLNKTNQVEFKKSYAWYMSHPDITKVMFDSISERSSRQNAALRAEIYKPKTASPAVKTIVAPPAKPIKITQ